MADACDAKQQAAAGEDERVAVFREKVQEAARIEVGVPGAADDSAAATETQLQSDALDGVVAWLKEQFVEEQNQPKLLQAIVDEAEKLSPPDALALLGAAMLWGRTTHAVRSAWQERREEMAERKRREMEAAYQKRLRDEESAVLKAIQANGYAVAGFYIAQVNKVNGRVSEDVSQAIQEQFDKAIENSAADGFYAAQKWLDILKQILPEAAYETHQAQMGAAAQKRFDAALSEENRDGLNEAKKWLALLETLTLPNQYALLEEKWQKAELRQKQREIEQNAEFLLQEARALISDGRLNDAREKCADARNFANKVQDQNKRKQYLNDANKLVRQIEKLKKPVRKSITVEDYLKRLSDSDLEEMGEDIKMKLKELENVDKKYKRRFFGALFASLIAIVVVAAGLFFFNNSLQNIEDQIESAQTKLDAVPKTVADHVAKVITNTDNLSTDLQSVQAQQANQEKSLGTVTDKQNELTGQLNDISAKLKDIEAILAGDTSEPPPPPKETWLENARRIGAVITPTNSVEVRDERLVLPDDAPFFDIPDIQVMLPDDASFQIKEDESGYELIDSGNTSWGTVKVQITRDGQLVDEGFYPIVENALADDNPQLLSLSWEDTAFKLLPPGTYELWLVTQRDLEVEPAAIIGAPYQFDIEPPAEAHVYNPTVEEYPTRLRTEPVWDCRAACAKEELSDKVQVVAYAVVPYAGNKLPYRLPVTPTVSVSSSPVLSFTVPLTVTSVITPVTLSPGMEIEPGNVSEYADSTTGVIYVGGNEAAKFFLARLPGTRMYYWLGETDALEFYYPELREKLLSLPELVPLSEPEN